MVDTINSFVLLWPLQYWCHLYKYFNLFAKCYAWLTLRLTNASITHWTTGKKQKGIQMSQIRKYPTSPKPIRYPLYYTVGWFHNYQNLHFKSYKYHYLKRCLKGEKNNLVTNVSISKQQYKYWHTDQEVDVPKNSSGSAMMGNRLTESQTKRKMASLTASSLQSSLWLMRDDRDVTKENCVWATEKVGGRGWDLLIPQTKKNLNNDIKTKHAASAVPLFWQQYTWL